MPRDPTPADPDPQDRKALMFVYSLTQQGKKQRLRGVKGAPRDAVDSALQHGDGRYRWPLGGDSYVCRKCLRPSKWLLSIALRL